MKQTTRPRSTSLPTVLPSPTHENIKTNTNLFNPNQVLPSYPTDQPIEVNMANLPLVHHHPATIFSASQALGQPSPPPPAPTPNRILIILNQPISSIEQLAQIWDTCEVVICADGGANRLYQLFEKKTYLRSHYVSCSLVLNKLMTLQYTPPNGINNISKFNSTLRSKGF